MESYNFSTMKQAVELGAERYMLCSCPICNRALRFCKRPLGDKAYDYRIDCDTGKQYEPKLHDLYGNDNPYSSTIDEAVIAWNDYCTRVMRWRNFYKYGVSFFLILLTLLPLIYTVVAYLSKGIFPYGCWEILCVTAFALVPLFIARFLKTRLLVAFSDGYEGEISDWKKKKNQFIVKEKPVKKKKETNNDLLDKLSADIEQMQKLCSTLEDEEVSQKSKALVNIVSNIHTYVKKYPERITVARRLITYYNEQLLHIMRTYDERLKMTANERIKYETSTKEVLGQLKPIYEHVYTLLTRSEADEMLTDIEILKHEIDMDMRSVHVTNKVREQMLGGE